MKQKTKIFLLLLSALLLFVLTGYLFLAFYYKDSFPMNTWINGVYCTGKTIEEVNTELLQNAEAPIVTITDRQELAYYFDLTQCSYELDYLLPLKQYQKEHNALFWIKNLNQKNRSVIAPAVSVEEGSARELWMQLPFVQEELQTDQSFAIRLGDEGYYLYDGLKNRLDVEKAYSQFLSAVQRGEKNFSLSDSGCYYDAEMPPDYEETLKLWEQVERFQKCGVIYDMGDAQIPLAGAVSAGFLASEDGIPVLDEEGLLVVDEKAVETFIKELASEYDTYGVERTFHSTRGDVVTISGGTYGTRLDQTAETAYLLEKLNALAASAGGNTHLAEENASAEELHIPAYKKKALYRGKNDIGSTYIEIDMTAQKMYYYEEGQLLLETDVVTGNLSRKWGTPEGVNFVYAKQKNRVLRGPGYASPVKFWMPVNGGIGIHDANWRSQFGGEIYKKSGSHGCINTPTEKMTQLYDMVEKGTPVVMFY